MLVTFLATLIVPLQFAVLFGVALSILLNTIRQSNKVVVTQWVLQPQGFPLEQPPPQRLPSHQLTLLHVYGSLFFAAAKNMEEMLPAVGDATHAVVAINLRGKSEIGSTFVTVLQRYSQALQARQGKLMLVGVDPLRSRPAGQDRGAQAHRRRERLRGHAAARRGAEPGGGGGQCLAGPAPRRLAPSRPSDCSAVAPDPRRGAPGTHDGPADPPARKHDDE